MNLEEGWRKHNKEMKQKNEHKLMLTFEEFCLFHKPRKFKKTKHISGDLSSQRIDSRVDNIPSLVGTGKVVNSKKAKNTYTGTLVKGIATMHKSNAVPVINEEQATEIARMRRG